MNSQSSGGNNKKSIQGVKNTKVDEQKKKVKVEQKTFNPSSFMFLVRGHTALSNENSTQNENYIANNFMWFIRGPNYGG